MSLKPYKITAVPTNIITGFLGAGKTSAILQLLKHKPATERWAILVNEFGEIGVDGGLINGQHSTQQGVFIREVPGGCMCCTAGVPMQIALNQLLKEARPDRLLIEPTGLGHPKEVLKVLSASHYHEVLSLQKTITLVDARQLSDSRYTSHDTFNQQIAIADSVIGNKVDLYNSDERKHLIDYVKKQGKTQASVSFTKHGEIALSALTSDSTVTQSTLDKDNSHAEHHHAHQKILTADLPMPECGFIKATNNGEGFMSIGWRFSSENIFEYQKLYVLLNATAAERIKAVFITDRGRFGFNITHDGLTITPLVNSEENITESRIEIIALKINENFEDELFACLLP